MSWAVFVSDNVNCGALFIFDFHSMPAEIQQILHTSTGHSIEKRLGCALKGETERTHGCMQVILLRPQTYRVRYTQFNDIST